MKTLTPSVTNRSRRFALLGVLAACTAIPALRAAAPVATPLGALTDSVAAPARVAAAASGQITVSDPRAGQVVVTDAFGRLVAVKSGLGTPLGLAVDATGTTYVADQAAGSVTVFDADWTPLGQLGAGTGEFLLPNYLALAPDGSVLVSDSAAQRIKVYAGGTLVRSFGSKGSGNGQFNFPAGLHVSVAGEVFVVDQINDRIVVFNLAGVFQRAFTLRPPGAAALSGRAQGLAADAAGRLYVADTFQGTVKVFDPDGTYVTKIGGYGEVAGKLASPAGVAVDAQGRLLVASTENGRVEVFGLDCFTSLAATPAHQLVAAGTTATFTATVGCGGSLAYQWQKDGADLPGATDATLTLTGVTAADAGDYTVVVTGGGGTPAASPAAKLVVVNPPVLVQGPVSQTVNLGGSATFTVQATGEGLTYQWSFKGKSIAGATTSALALADVTVAAQGTYTVTVANPAGTVTPPAATLTVIEPAFITGQPASQIVAERSTVTLGGAAAGTPPLSYQWFYNGAPLTGQTQATLALPNATPVLDGAYSFTVANAAGSATSAVATVTVLPDTVPPVAVGAEGGYATNLTITVRFSKSLDPVSAQMLANYELVGPGGLGILSATLNNATNVILTLNGPRVPMSNYDLIVRDVRDSAYLNNLMAPNPTTLPLAQTVELIGINGQPWKYLQPTNNVMDSQPWKTTSFDDSGWATGYGIFYGNRTNSVYQPDPNPNVTLPFSLNAADPARHQVHTILNVFTNAGNAIQTITYYFRTQFQFPGETNGLTLYLRTMHDDGIILWLNGVELRRNRMNDGTATYATLAKDAGKQEWDPKMTDASRSVSIAALQPGANTLAVEIHQRTLTDDDVTYGCLLEARVLRFAAPSPVAQPVLRLSRAENGDLLLQWSHPGCVLESSQTLNGPWSSMGASSPVLVPKSAATQPAQFFRLRQN